MKNIKNLRVGIVGVGRMGKVRLEELRRLGLEAVYCTDLENSRLESARIYFPTCIFVKDINDLPWNSLDAIFICSPPGSHFQIAKKALKNNVAVFVEKPATLNSASTLELAQLANRKGIPTAVGYMNRIRPSIRKARELLSKSPPYAFSARWVCAPYNIPWWRDITQSGGAFLEQGTHIIDLLCYLLGEINAVTAVGEESNKEKQFHSIATSMRFNTGATGNVLYSSMGRDKHIQASFFCEDGDITLSDWDFNLYAKGAVILGAPIGTSRNWIFDQETRSFLEMVTGTYTSEPLADFASAAATQILVEKIISITSTKK